MALCALRRGKIAPPQVSGVRGLRVSKTPVLLKTKTKTPFFRAPDSKDSAPSVRLLGPPCCLQLPCG